MANFKLNNTGSYKNGRFYKFVSYNDGSSTGVVIDCSQASNVFQARVKELFEVSLTIADLLNFPQSMASSEYHSIDVL